MRIFFEQYRLPIIIVSVVILIMGAWFGGKHVYDSIYDKGYTAGKKFEEEQNLAAKNEAKNQADTERAELNNRLEALNLKYQDLLKSRAAQEEVNQKELEKYKASEYSKKKCLDDGLIDLYNNSL